MSDNSRVSLYNRITIMASALVPVVRAFEKEFGEEQTRQIVGEALKDIGRGWGEAINQIDGDGRGDRLTKGLSGFQEDDALDYDILKQDDDAYDFDVTRCRYAQFMDGIGAKDLGPLLICNLDHAMAEALGMTLEREQTIMTGNPRCSFRFRAIA